MVNLKLGDHRYNPFRSDGNDYAMALLTHSYGLSEAIIRLNVMNGCLPESNQ